MTKYYFTRHGESQANVDRTFAGAADSPLTEKGRAAAKAEGERLVATGQSFDLIISSPLSRAKDTADILAESLSYPLQEIAIEPLLTERSFGRLVGKPWDSLPDETSDIFAEEGGESIEVLARRVTDSLQVVRDISQAKTSVLIVGHGTWHQMAVALLSNKKPSAFLEVHGLPNNTVVEFPL